MKIPFPKYDRGTVARIEDYLNQADLTEPWTTHPMGPREDMLDIVFTQGIKYVADTYHRPMFELIDDGAGSGMLQPVRPSCEACDNFAVSWNCPDHPHTGQEYQSGIKLARDLSWETEL